MHPWMIQVLATLLAFGAQVAAIAFFLGKMKAYQESNAKLVDQIQRFADERLQNLTTRVDTVDSFTREAAKTFSAFDARLSELSTNTRDLPNFRERFVAFEAASLAHQKRQDADSMRTHTSIESLQRQVASLATYGPGRIVEIPATKKGL